VRVKIRKAGSKGLTYRYGCTFHAPGIAKQFELLGATTEIDEIPRDDMIRRICLPCFAEDARSQ